MKKCFKCGEIKDLALFYRHNQMADKHLNKCIECAKKDVSLHREENIDKIRQYDRERGARPERIADNVSRMKVYRTMFPEKYHAHTKVNNAIRDGKITKPTECPTCGGTRQIVGHHEDYSKPLDVEWMCSVCHSKLHEELAGKTKTLPKTKK